MELTRCELQLEAAAIRENGETTLDEEVGLVMVTCANAGIAQTSGGSRNIMKLFIGTPLLRSL